MPDSPIYVAKPYLPERQVLEKYINEIYATNRLTNNGPLVKKLEERLKDFLGVRNVIPVANGTLALQVAYKALSLKSSAITTPYSFVATTSSLVWENINPVFADIHPKRLTIDPQKIKESLSNGVSGIIPVHVYGNPCDVTQIQELAQKNSLNVIYDAAHAFGVRYAGRSLLSYGDISVLSFHATKLFHTIEGGALITDNDELATKIRLMINFGIAGYEDIRDVGINAKMNEFEAAMGLALLDNIGSILEAYRRNWRRYWEELQDIVEFPELAPNTEWNYSYVPVLFADEAQLLKVMSALNRENIYPRRYFYPSLDTLSYLLPQRPCTVSRNISSRVLCLPTFFDMAEKDISSITSIIKRVVKDV
ncbi:aminotransferase DegT [Candidatus Marsarchaeota G2 archaeon BE_D]|jgi:dTDP-4-amino-4,6-dideoxygalactose transaminase|uniref:Aminotransferase DegT n=1 Tax=Candidatus Marsarchaeota G2 archaeon BE_D TaxID=1978158 RepID=A0A2R6CC76_9ARCH|nr:MAG: aminotransferase DegT [Candidatus Marsarchaeota G2 archaeon BE_D]